jgi:hypothetical protein
LESYFPDAEKKEFLDLFAKRFRPDIVEKQQRQIPAPLPGCCERSLSPTFGYVASNSLISSQVVANCSHATAQRAR